MRILRKHKHTKTLTPKKTKMGTANRNTLSNASDYELDYMSDDDSNPSFNRSSDDRCHDHGSDSKRASQKVWWKSTKMWYVVAACSAFIAVGVLIAEVVSDNESSINATNRAPSTFNETTTTSPTASQFSGSAGGATTVPSMFLSPTISPNMAPFTYSTKKPTIESTKMPRSTKAPFPTESTKPSSKAPKAPSVKTTNAPSVKSTKAPSVKTTKAPSIKTTKAPRASSSKAPKTPNNVSTKMPSGVNYVSTKMPASGTSTKIPSNSSTMAPTLSR